MSCGYLSDRPYRKEMVKTIKNATVRAFFEREFEAYTFGYRSDGIAPIQNKVGAFLADPLLQPHSHRLRNGHQHSRHHGQGKVLLVNLAKGRLGEDSSSLLGGLLVTTIGLAAFSRADMPPEKRRDFFVYVDEFQTFTTLAVTNMLAELRKYRVGFTIAHQYLHQLEPDVRHAVLGNVGTLISFRLGAEDAPYFVREFVERFQEVDLLQLPNYRIYLKLMIDGMPSAPFSATTLEPLKYFPQHIALTSHIARAHSFTLRPFSKRAADPMSIGHDDIKAPITHASHQLRQAH